MKKPQKKTAYDRVRFNSGQYRRILWTGLFLGVLAFVPVSVRLFQLMVQNYEYYSALARSNQSRTTQVSGQRGTIYDRNMEVLACNRPVSTLYLNPRELQQSGADVEQLSRVLGQLLEMDPQSILEKAKNRKLRYQKIAAGLEQELADRIRSAVEELEISGVHLEPNLLRQYPQGSLASQVVGFTNSSNEGAEGVEAAYNSFLQAGAGKVVALKGNNEMDMPFSYESYIASQPGCDVILTLDCTVQACLEKQMNAAIERYDVRNGAFGMVMDVNTGAVLAMATLGGYDPNHYLEIYDPAAAQALEQEKLAYLAQPQDSQAFAQGKEAYQKALRQAQLAQWRNRCLSDGYEPGSTFKVLTMSAALDSGAIDLETPFFCSGAEQIPGRSQLLHCWRSTGHGSQKTPQALQNSCNLAFAHIALKLGGEKFYEYIEKFGILEKTGIDLAGESKGIFFSKELVTDTDKWGTASLTSGSFGQTFKLTPLQLVRAISAVVNGGNLMEPYLVSEVLDADGNTVLRQEPTPVRRVIREETSRTMCTLMESVVTEGTAKNAQVLGFSIGGKTGTSEKIDVLDDNGNKTLDKIVSFVGVAPMDDPQYIVLVALDTPSRQTGMYISGGVMAAPTVGAVLADILPYLDVARAQDPEQVQLPDLTDLTLDEAQTALQSLGLEAIPRGSQDAVTGQLPEAGAWVSPGSQVLVYFGQPQEAELVPVPDFSGMNRQQASDAAGRLGLNIQVQGNPEVSVNVQVAAQSHQKDTMVPEGTVIQLTFVDKMSQ